MSKWPSMRLKSQLQLNNTKLTELVSFPGRKKKKKDSTQRKNNQKSFGFKAMFVGVFWSNMKPSQNDY